MILERCSQQAPRVNPVSTHHHLRSTQQVDLSNFLPFLARHPVVLINNHRRGNSVQELGYPYVEFVISYRPPWLFFLKQTCQAQFPFIRKSLRNARNNPSPSRTRNYGARQTSQAQAVPSFVTFDVEDSSSSRHVTGVFFPAA